MKDLMSIAKGSATNLTCEDVINWWRNSNFKTLDDFKIVLDNFKVIFTQNSLNIEDVDISYHQTRELFENGQLINYTGDVSHVLALQNHKYAYGWLIDNVVKRRKIDTKFILELHDILMRGCYDQSRWNKGERPGSFKVNDFMVGDNVGTSPEEVLNEIEELNSELDVDCNPITKAAYYHCAFENIHPFADGNGRTGRALMNYILMLEDYPPLVIYNEDKLSYYMALTIYDKSENIDGFEQFIKSQILKTWKSYVIKNKEE